MSTHIIVNPVAGGGRSGRAGPAVAEAARRHWPGVELFETRGPGDATRLARAAAEVPVARVIVVGGDGTVHEAANGFLAEGARVLPALGVIPVGTGNDFARLTGMHRMRPAEAVSRLARGSTTRFDVGRAWDEYFVNSLGLGLDAAVAARVARGGRLRGWGAYAAALVGAWRGHRPERWEVTVGDERWDEEHLLIEVGIGPASGGGFRLTPDARPDDGLLDLCAVRPMGLLRLLSIGPRVLWGGHRNAPEVRLRQATALRVAAVGGRLLAHFDGEIRDPGRSTIDIVLEPRRLSVLLAG